MIDKTCFTISAHPDDMEIGMGGTAAKLVKSGIRVISIVLTDGRRGPNAFGVDQDRLVQMRQQEARQAAEILGVSEVFFAGLPNLTEFDGYRAATQKLHEWMAIYRPAEIFTLHPELDRHPTHRLAGKLTLECASDFKDAPRIIWGYEVWGLFAFWDRFEDITAQIELKRRAIEKHLSQVGSVPYADGVIGLNRWRAIFADPSSTSVPEAFAEVFLKIGG